MRNALVLSLFLSACGWSEERFLVNGVPDFCDAAAQCVGFESAACIDHVRAQDRTGCDYDPAAARQCARSLDSDGTCEDNGDLGTFSYIAPEACDRVWDGCPMFEVPIDEGTSPPPPETAR